MKHCLSLPILWVMPTYIFSNVIFDGYIPPVETHKKLEQSLLNPDKELPLKIPQENKDSLINGNYNIPLPKNTFINSLEITPYYTNYFLPINYSFNKATKDKKRMEAKFQISFKAPLIKKIQSLPLDIYFAYSQRSFWQLYNINASRNFRENNYQPELFMRYDFDFAITPLRYYIGHLKYAQIGYIHESNGGGVQNSRSWDRIALAFTYVLGNAVLEIHLWRRFSEPPKSDSHDARGDDNPNIMQYTGYGEIILSQQFNRHLISTQLRGNTSTYKGRVIIDYSYLLNNSFYLYMQYLIGYGESLIDYEQFSRRLGIGVKLSI